MLEAGRRILHLPAVSPTARPTRFTQTPITPIDRPLEQRTVIRELQTSELNPMNDKRRTTNYKLPLLALALAAIEIIASAGGGTRAVLADDCTRRAMPENVQTLIDGAVSGDVVCMAPGVYRGPLLLQSKRGVTLRGAGQHETIIAGGTRDSMLIFDSDTLTLENFTLYYGHPSNAYISNSRGVTFRNVDAGGGGIGIHFDNNTIATLSDSFVYAMDGDGVLVRHDSNVTIQRNWIFANGGVGASTVGDTATTTITHNVISDNKGPGVFAGQTPCALLPPGFVEVPDCYLTNLSAFVGDTNVILDGNVVQASNSTGIVMFPGTRGTFRNNHIWRNHLSGLFAWGANVSSESDEFDGNDEHAIEFRAYPDPLKYGKVGTEFPVRAVGAINHADIHDTVVLPETGTLGGGVLGQGANLDVTNSHIYRNRGIGVSYVNTSLGLISGNEIDDNRGSAICQFRAGTIRTPGNNLHGNAVDDTSTCHETTP